jgi:hypothetical protein
MFDTGSDPVGQLLRDRVAGVAAEVSVPDWRRVIEEQARRRTRRRVRRASLTVTVMALAATIVVALLPLARAPGGGATGYGSFHLMAADMPAAAWHAPLLAGPHVLGRSVPATALSQSSIAFGASSAYVLATAPAHPASACGRLLRISQATAAVTASLPFRFCPNAVAYGSGSVWVLASGEKTGAFRLAQVNPVTLATVSITVYEAGAVSIIRSARGAADRATSRPARATPAAAPARAIPAAAPARVIPAPVRATPALDRAAPAPDRPVTAGVAWTLAAAASRHVYVAATGWRGGGQINVVDTVTKQLTRTMKLPVADGQITTLSASESTVWAGTANGWVLGLDPATAAVRAAQHVGTRVASLSAAPTGVWVSVDLPVPRNSRHPGQDIVRLDPRTGALARDTRLPMSYVATDGSRVWALGSGPPRQAAAGLVAELNPETGTIIHRARLPAPGDDVPSVIGVSAGRAWVLNGFLGTLTRFTT